MVNPLYIHTCFHPTSSAPTPRAVSHPLFLTSKVLPQRKLPQPPSLPLPTCIHWFTIRSQSMPPSLLRATLCLEISTQHSPLPWMPTLLHSTSHLHNTSHSYFWSLLMSTSSGRPSATPGHTLPLRKSNLREALLLEKLERLLHSAVIRCTCDSVIHADFPLLPASYMKAEKITIFLT